MVTVWKNHGKSLAITQQISEIVLNREFINLCEELLYLYKNTAHHPEKEAFQDALYSFLAQRDSARQYRLHNKKALSFPG
jgi:hypothetical protein